MVHDHSGERKFDIANLKGLKAKAPALGAAGLGSLVASMGQQKGLYHKVKMGHLTPPEVRAAKKLQAVYRGFVVRRQMAAKARAKLAANPTNHRSASVPAMAVSPLLQPADHGGDRRGRSSTTAVMEEVPSNSVRPPARIAPALVSRPALAAATRA
eukprot:SAG11_NODE_12177_length_717_cov_1.245955_1_plen_155_part_10